MSKNPQHDCVKLRGGGQGPFTQCVKKTSNLVEDGFPKHHHHLGLHPVNDRSQLFKKHRATSQTGLKRGGGYLRLGHVVIMVLMVVEEGGYPPW